MVIVGLKISVFVSSVRMHHFYHKLPSLYHGLRTILYPKAFRVIVKIQWAADYSKNLRNLFVIPNAV
jgi:hypothetical protein